MVPKQHIDIEAHTHAAANDVYTLLRDGASRLRWTEIDSFQREPAGTTEPEEVGAIRVAARER
jgi:hypothetical protein